MSTQNLLPSQPLSSLFVAPATRRNPSRHLNRFGRFVAVVVALSVPLAQPVFAANDAWSTAPGSATFSGANWTTGTTTPGAATGTITSGDSLFFGTSSVTTLNEDKTAGFTIGGLTFNSGASAFTIAGNAFTLGGGGITNNSTANQTINDNITLSADQTWLGGTGSGTTLTLGGSVTGSGITLTTNGGNSGNQSSSTVFTGAVSLGTLKAQGNGGNGNNYSGNPTTTFNGSSTLTASNVTLARSNIVFGGSSTITLSGDITQTDSWANLIIAGSANVTTANVLMASNAGDQTGQLVLNGGTLTTASLSAYDRGGSGGAGTQSALLFNGTQINSTASTATFVSILTTNGGATEAFVGAGGLLFNTAGFNDTIGVPLVDLNSTVVSGNSGLGGATAGAGKMVKSGAGALTLSGANTYSGGTTVNQGTLAITNATGLGATTGPLNVSNTNTTAAGTATILNLFTTRCHHRRIAERHDCNPGQRHEHGHDQHRCQFVHGQPDGERHLRRSNCWHRRIYFGQFQHRHTHAIRGKYLHWPGDH